MSCSIIHCRSFYGRYQRDRTSTGYVTPQTDHTSLVVRMINSFCDCITSLGCSAIPSTLEQLFWVKEHWRTIIHLPPCAGLKAPASSPQMPWLVWFARSPVTRPEVWQEHWKNTDSLNSFWFLCCRQCIHPFFLTLRVIPKLSNFKSRFPFRKYSIIFYPPWNPLLISHDRSPAPVESITGSPQPSLNLRGDHTLTRFTKVTTFSNSCWAWQALSHPLQLKPFQFNHQRYSEIINNDPTAWNRVCVCVALLASAVDRTVAGGTCPKYEVPAWFASGKKECKVEETACFFLLLQITTILLDTYPVKTCENLRWQY